MERLYADHAWQQAAALLAIDSPSGFTKQAAQWVCDAFSSLGFAAHITQKGGVLADLGGTDSENALLLSAHTDTLGGMVAQIKGNEQNIIEVVRQLTEQGKISAEGTKLRVES